MNKFAVIDIGSNSVRLMMIASGKVLYKTIKTTRLGEGLAFSSKLCENAMQRTKTALADFYTKAKEEGAEKIFAFATAAMRSAKNGQAFADCVEKEIGLKIEIISGDEEAEIGILGAFGGEDGAIIDIGGASTELIVQKNGAVAYRKSLDIGVVRIRDLCDRSQEKTRKLSLETVKKYGEPTLTKKTYAIGGTATTIAALLLNLTSYDAKAVSKTVVSRRQVRELADELFSKSVEEISSHPCVDPLRADVLAGGVEWLYAILEYLNIDEIFISDGDNLEGYALSRGLLGDEYE
jgi:exopolyphosphatase/guanosine-5'-triphosphate,3'-diphosphate pyrophosphatase